MVRRKSKDPYVAVENALGVFTKASEGLVAAAGALKADGEKHAERAADLKARVRDEEAAIAVAEAEAAKALSVADKITALVSA